MLLPLLIALPLGSEPVVEPPQDFAPLHARELELHRDEPRAIRHFPAPGERSNVQRIVYGYLPYWVSDTSQFRWDLLTHVADFSIEMNSDGTLGALHGWPDTDLVDAAHAAGVKVEPVFTLFSSTAIGTLLGSATRRSTAIENMIDQMEAGGADGVSIDFEGVPASAAANHTLFFQELRARLTARGHANAGISIAAPAVDWSNVFDIPALLQSIDVYFIMGYDYFWGGSEVAGPTGIFRTDSKWRTATSWSGLRSVADVSRKAGEAGRKKIAYGIPYYGREYVTSGNTWPSSASSSPGTATYSAARKALADGTPSVVDEAICQPGMIWQESGVWHQLWHEDVASLGCKYDLVLEHAIGGTGMWALGSDNGYPDLWNLLENRFKAPAKLGEGSRDAPVAIGAFPFEDTRDTSKGGFRYFDYYSCKDTVAEYGREFVYQLDLCQPGNLHIQVDAVGGDDPDIHLLSGLQEKDCIARNDVTIDQALQPGRYYVVVDTYVSDAVELEGPYQLHVDFAAQAGTQPCPAGTVCQAGSCVCDGGLVSCGGVCVDTASDPSHCGDCGTVCVSGQSCHAGVCTSSPPEAGVDATSDAPAGDASLPPVDGGDGAVISDGGSGAFGASSAEDSGCSCRAGAAGARDWLGVLAGLSLLGMGMRRGRR